MFEEAAQSHVPIIPDFFYQRRWEDDHWSGACDNLECLAACLVPGLAPLLIG